MAERKQIDFAYMFSEEVHAYRCSRPRYRGQVGRASFALEKAEAGRAPLAFTVKERGKRTEAVAARRRALLGGSVCREDLELAKELLELSCHAEETVWEKRMRLRSHSGFRF